MCSCPSSATSAAPFGGLVSIFVQKSSSQRAARCSSPLSNAEQDNTARHPASDKCWEMLLRSSSSHDGSAEEFLLLQHHIGTEKRPGRIKINASLLPVPSRELSSSGWGLAGDGGVPASSPGHHGCLQQTRHRAGGTHWLETPAEHCGDVKEEGKQKCSTS